MIAPPAMLGMLGGGQLGRFFVMAAHELGYRVMVLDPDPSSLPSLATVGRGCLALCGFAAVFFLGAWWNLRRAWHGRPG